MANFNPQCVPTRLQRNPELARDGLAERASRPLPQRYLYRTDQAAAAQV